MGDERPDTATWMLSNPWIGASIVAWVALWLAVELVFYLRTKRALDLAETRRSLAVAVLVGSWQVAVSLLLTPLLWLAFPYRLTTLAMDAPWHWFLAWVVVDFAYYWIHRGLHVTGIGWALHASHHSIRQLTLLDSLRMSWGESPVGVFAYGVPLVLLGVPPYAAGGFYLFVALYQFIVHTEMDWSTGPLDGVVYTPAAHRMHHSTLRAEGDRNFGGCFLLFDRWFGTHLPTDRHARPAVYGLPDRVATTVREAAIGEMEAFVKGFRAARGLRARWRYVFVRPPAA